MSNIHPSAVVEDGAKISNSARVGPFCTVGPDVTLSDNVELISHVAVSGLTSIGAGTRVFPFASLGHQPQDLKFTGEVSQLIIGLNNTIREQVTMNPGTKGDNLVTKVGDNGLFMVGSHVAHDCQIGDNVILVNNATLGGHVKIGDFAIIGGLSAVHQFVRIGTHAMVGGVTGVENDIIPYGSVIGNRARLSGLNIIGLRRRNFTRDQIHELRNAYKQLFMGEGTMTERVDHVAGEFSDNDPVMQIINFIREDSSRAICQPETENAT